MTSPPYQQGNSVDDHRYVFEETRQLVDKTDLAVGPFDMDDEQDACDCEDIVDLPIEYNI